MRLPGGPTGSAFQSRHSSLLQQIVKAHAATKKAVPMDRLLCKPLNLMVGASGFEPQTPTVSMQSPLVSNGTYRS